MATLQDIIRKRQQSEFVGRGDFIRAFHDNLNLRPDDERRWHICAVSGQGGVGKTSLLQQFRKIADEAGTATASVDEFDDDILKVIATFAEQLIHATGLKASKLLDRYRDYREHRRELELDPEVPQGFPAYLGKTLVKTGIKLGRRIPAAGAVFDLIDEEAVASQAADWTAYVARKLSNRDDVQLMHEPVEVLSPLFVSDICKVAQKSPVLLIFDTYERTSDFLDPWLRDVLDGSYGNLPLNLTLVIAGRDELERNQWVPYSGIMSRHVLDPFTETEARDYLTQKGVTDERTVTTILKLTGGLPLLVATLASESPEDPGAVGEPSGTAVERFLKWVPDPTLRDAAVDVALCRSFNRDVVEVLVGEERAATVFAWLQRMPFAVEKADAWYYHQVVRSAMLRHRKRQSPQNWSALHTRMAEYYRERAVAAEGERESHPDGWEAAALDRVYHHLCATGELSAAVNGFADSLGRRPRFARRWAETVEQAGAESDRIAVEEWGAQMVTALKARNKQHKDFAEFVTGLLAFSELNSVFKPVLYRMRGRSYRLADMFPEALEDLGIVNK